MEATIMAINPNTTSKVAIPPKQDAKNSLIKVFIVTIL
jgi:hypothetical protein